MRDLVEREAVHFREDEDGPLLRGELPCGLLDRASQLSVRAFGLGSRLRFTDEGIVGRIRM